MADERRQFQRTVFNTEAVLKIVDEHWPVHLLDISLKGILTTLPAGKTLTSQQHVNVDIPLNTNDVIRMETRVSHLDADCIGFVCERIDLDSITHVKRLLELNLCDPDMLQREITALIH